MWTAIFVGIIVGIVLLIIWVLYIEFYLKSRFKKMPSTIDPTLLERLKQLDKIIPTIDEIINQPLYIPIPDDYMPVIPEEVEQRVAEIRELILLEQHAGVHQDEENGNLLFEMPVDTDNISDDDNIEEEIDINNKTNSDGEEGDIDIAPDALPKYGAI